MVGKIQVNLVLLLTAVSLVISCLVTNCPRGGKRGKPDYHLMPNDVIPSGMKKWQLCNPRKESCFGVFCSSKVLCGNEGQCVTREVCCSKRLCKLLKSCESEQKQVLLSSLLLTKILRYSL